jgi:xanthine dehydrogenase accessory factor
MATLPLDTAVHRALVEAIDHGRPFAVALVLRSSGSVPREAGTRAIIDSDGQIRGTIGGGLLESEAQRLAVQSLQSGQPAAFDFRFAGASAERNDPVCGGTMRVLIDPSSSNHRSAYSAAADAAQARRRGVLLTHVNTAQSTDVTVRWHPADAALGDEDGALVEAIDTALKQAAAQSVVVPSATATATREALVEPVVPSARLLVAGGGHVGRALAHQAYQVGFEVIVVEDRPEFVHSSRYQPGITTVCGQFCDVLAEYPIDADTYVAIVGRGHPVDMKALAASIHSPAAYVGMMGSRRKVALVRKAFLESGQATADDFDRIYAPIGLRLGAETVPEIAASIVAQLIAVRRTGAAPRFE